MSPSARIGVATLAVLALAATGIAILVMATRECVTYRERVDDLRLRARAVSRMSETHGEFVERVLGWLDAIAVGNERPRLSVQDRRNMVLFAFECAEENGIVADAALAAVGGASDPELAAVVYRMFRGIVDDTVEQDRGVVEHVCANPVALRHPIVLLFSVAHARLMGPCALTRDVMDAAFRVGYGSPVVPMIAWSLAGLALR